MRRLEITAHLAQIHLANNECKQPDGNGHADKRGPDP